MAIYYIPTDFTGGTILVNEGDVFIVEATAGSNVKFESASGTPTNFDIQFTTSNSNSFNVVVETDLTPTITIADNVSLGSVFLDARNADAVDLTAGDNVTLDKYNGPGGVDTLIIGDNFTTNNDFKTNNGDDYIQVGSNFTANKLDAGGGTDTVVSGTPGANITNTETVLYPDGIVTGTAGNDVMGIGYSDAETDAIDGWDGNDDIILGLEGSDTINGGAGNDTIDGGADNDSIEGGIGADLIYGGAGADTIGGGTDADTIDGGTGNDIIDGGAGGDSLIGGAGSDTIDGGADADTIDGGSGDDSILGGDGNDTLTGGDAVAASGGDRMAFEWSNIPDPNDGGQIDNLDSVTVGSQTVGGTTVDFSVTGGAGQYETTTVYTDGIDAGGGAVDTNSALGLDGSDGIVTLDFSNAVENVQFRVNDFEANSETLTIRAYDANNNLISFNVTEGSGVNGSDTDAVAGNDTFQGPLSNTGDNSPTGSILVEIAGPVARIELDYTQTNGGLTVTDVWFDDPNAVVAADGGNDTLDGGAGDDVIDGGDGNDSISGGAENDIVRGGDGDDTISGGAGNDTLMGSDSEDVQATIASFDFEDTSGLIQYQDATFASNDTLGHITGDNALVFTSDSTFNAGNYGGVQIDLPTDDLTVGETFRLSLWVRTDGPDSQLTASYQSGSGGSHAFVTTTVDATSEWQYIEVTGMLDEVHDKLYLWGEDPSTTYAVDALRFEKVSVTSDNDQISGGDGADVIYASDGEDTLDGGAGNDKLDGGAGNDHFDFQDSFGTDTLIGGAGSDRIDLLALTSGVTVNFTAPNAGTITNGTDSISFSETEIYDLTNQADTLVGGTSSLNVYGWGGDDLLYGSSAGDGIRGGTGDDTIIGGAGDDDIGGTPMPTPSSSRTASATTPSQGAKPSPSVPTTTSSTSPR
ncbi:hypothetical protein [Sulfitobacter sediminilitoris]|uniref:hypothetical protein n=1 Tax=Sulfitobacter sediminilitoris TaxID=2698830 RepID=UPI00361FBE31